MDNPFEGMTDEQLFALMQKMQQQEGEGTAVTPPAPKPEPLRYQLTDGSVVEAPNAEEMNKALLARLQAQQPEPPEPTQTTPQIQPTPETYDHEKFAKLLTKDAREGLDYVDKVQFGMPVRQLVPILVAGMAQLTQRLQKAETQQFIDANPEYQGGPETRRAIETIMQERHWQPTRETLQDAYDIARGRGLVKAKKEEPKPETTTPAFIPPRPPSRGNATDEPSTQDIIRQANDMPFEKLHDLLVEAGVLSQ